MHRRKWDAKTKVMIVLQGLQGKPVAEICNERLCCKNSWECEERLVRSLYAATPNS